MNQLDRMKQFVDTFDQREFNANIPNVSNDDVCKVIMGWHKCDGRWVDAAGVGRSKRFEPLYSAEDDLAVLARVKAWRDGEERDEERYNRFWFLLAALLRSRDRYYDDTVLQDVLYYIESYRIGDYARAAVMTYRMHDGWLRLEDLE